MLVTGFAVYAGMASAKGRENLWTTENLTLEDQKGSIFVCPEWLIQSDCWVFPLPKEQIHKWLLRSHYLKKKKCFLLLLVFTVISTDEICNPNNLSRDACVFAPFSFNSSLISQGSGTWTEGTFPRKRDNCPVITSCFLTYLLNYEVLLFKFKIMQYSDFRGESKDKLKKESFIMIPSLINGMKVVEET